LANADPIKFAPNQPKIGPAGLFCYGRTFAHEAQPLLIETWCRRLFDSVLNSALVG
jgi:hypothetical protein